MTSLPSPPTADALGPAPGGGSVDLTIDCGSDPEGLAGVAHRVVVRPDWTVWTPHGDLAAERIARSFGAWCTCLSFADLIVPAYRDALAALMGERHTSRTSDIDIERFLAPRIARAHSAAPLLRHLYAALLARAGELWAASADPRVVESGAHGLLHLWREGIPPFRVETIARTVPQAAWPLPTRFFMRAARDDDELDWLANAVTAYPEHEFVAWAVDERMHRHRAPADVVWRMYELGLTAADAIAAQEERVSVSRVARLASESAIEARTAARWLVLWAQLGIDPSPGQLAQLSAHDRLRHPPARWARDSMIVALRRLGAPGIDRTALAVMLSLAADDALVEHALDEGIRTPSDPRFGRMITRRSTS